MCTQQYLNYQCGCRTKGEFKQCDAKYNAQSNLQCAKTNVVEVPSRCYCPKHLPKDDKAGLDLPGVSPVVDERTTMSKAWPKSSGSFYTRFVIILHLVDKLFGRRVNLNSALRSTMPSPISNTPRPLSKRFLQDATAQSICRRKPKPDSIYRASAQLLTRE